MKRYSANTESSTSYVFAPELAALLTSITIKLPIPKGTVLRCFRKRPGDEPAEIEPELFSTEQRHPFIVHPGEAIEFRSNRRLHGMTFEWEPITPGEPGEKT